MPNKQETSGRKRTTNKPKTVSKKSQKSKKSKVSVKKDLMISTENPPELEGLYEKVRGILHEARRNVVRRVNAEMVRAYWFIGEAIVEYEQKGNIRAEYGQQVINSLSERLTAEFGKGFPPTNLKYMRQFYLTFPKSHALRDQLSWTHYRLLLKVEKAEAREYYEQESAAVV